METSEIKEYCYKCKELTESDISNQFCIECGTQRKILNRKEKRKGIIKFIQLCIIVIILAFIGFFIAGYLLELIFSIGE